MTKAFSHENLSDANGGTDVWITPKYILDALGAPEAFDTDPCAAVKQPWPTAKAGITEETDGLTSSWYGNVWLNPPYKGAEAWLRRMSLTKNGIVLIFARTDTKAWHDYIFPHATSILFLKGRVKFHRESGELGKTGSGSPSVLIAYGEDNHERLKNCGLEGKLIRIN